MSRYIKVDAFEKRLEEERKYLILREQYGAEHILVHHAINILVEFPTVDVVEVVRCKDCKYCEHWYSDKGRCFLWHESGIDVFEDGFCNYAERREDDEVVNTKN